MIKNPINICDLSGDSTITNYRYEAGFFSCIYKDYETDLDYLLKIKTKIFYLDSENKEEKYIHIRLNNLASVIPSDEKSGLYIFPEIFSEQMNFIREKFNLALGYTTNSHPYFIQVRNYKVIFACPISSMEDIILEKL